jgi:hypothetical protein
METDLLVIGGAVGASLGGPAGWSAFLYVPAESASMKICGKEPDIQLGQADVLPFAAALLWYDENHPDRGAITNVLCCTDSRDLVEAANGHAARNGTGWDVISGFEKRGYRFTWVLESRDHNPAVFQEAARVRQELVAALSER